MHKVTLTQTVKTKTQQNSIVEERRRKKSLFSSHFSSTSSLTHTHTDSCHLTGARCEAIHSDIHPTTHAQRPVGKTFLLTVKYGANELEMRAINLPKLAKLMTINTMIQRSVTLDAITAILKEIEIRYRIKVSS